MDTNITTTRTLDELQNSNGTFVVPQQDPTSSGADAMIANALTQAKLERQNAQQQEQQQQSVVDTGSTEIQSLFNEVMGEAPARAQLESEQGLPQMNKELRDLQALQTKQTAEYLQGLQTIQSKNITQGTRNVGELALNRQRGIDSLLTSSLIQAKQGNIEFARNLVDSAISAKYTPIKQALEFKQGILERNYDRLDKKTQKVADAKKAEWDAQLKEIDRQVEEDKEANKYLLNAIQGNAPQDRINQAKEAIKNGEPLSTVAGILGEYSMSPADRLDLALKNAQIANIYDSIGQRSTELTSEAVQKEQEEQAKRLASKGMLDKMKDLLSNPLGFSTAVGTAPEGLGFFGRTAFIGRGDKLKFLADLSNVLSKKTLQELIDVKAQGATFGALSDQERQELSNAATALNGYIRRRNDGTIKAVVGSESAVLKELLTIQKMAEISYINSGGVLPGSQGEQELADDFVNNMVGPVLNNQYINSGYDLR